MTTSVPLRVAIVADLLDERWPSMDLIADMLARQLNAVAERDGLSIHLLRPSFARPGAAVSGLRATWQRYQHRFWSYPRWLQHQALAYDVFHVIDHSYAHVVHSLAADRTVVTCHDIDAFLPIVAPGTMATRLPTALTRRVLSGFSKAAHVVCVSDSTREEVLANGLVPAERVSVAHNGTREELSPEPSLDADRQLEQLIGPRPTGTIELLHVGTGIARKRIDLLLEVFRAVLTIEPGARLLKAGGQFTAEQRESIAAHGLADRIVSVPFLTPALLASLYRRADLLLQPSEREGFGLPVIEAMACGTPVVATDLAVFREVGGDAATYCRLGDVSAWQRAILAHLNADAVTRAQRRMAGLARAAGFSWPANASAMVRLYRSVAAAATSKVAA